MQNHQFSSYIASKKPALASTWNNCLDSSDSSGSWTQGEGLPPPPTVECEQFSSNQLTAQETAVLSPHTKHWDNEESEDQNAEKDENFADSVANQTQDSGSMSDELGDTESECITEIFVPKQSTSASPSTRLVIHQRKSAPHGSNSRRSRHQMRNDVIPSVSSDNIRLSSPPFNIPTSALTSEDVGTNIDSGISNETSQVPSQQNVGLKTRAMSVSSSSHYSSSYSCGSRGEIPSPKLRHQRIDDIGLYMEAAKVSRIVGFLSTAYAVILVLFGVILPVFEVKNGIDTNSYVFEAYFMYLYGISILFLLYVYATVLRDNRTQSQIRHNLSSHPIQETPGVQPMGAQHRKDNFDNIPSIASLFLRVAAVLFCAGSLVDCGLRLSGQMGNGCTLQFHSAAQPIAQATLMITEIYFIFNNAKMNIRRYPVTAKFGIMHLIATNTLIWITSTITQYDNYKKQTFQRYSSSNYELTLPPNNTSANLGEGSDYNEVEDAGEDNLLTVLNNNRIDALGCTSNEEVVQLTLKASAYTYPCTAQFCLLAMSILYVMWRSVDLDSDTRCNECKEHSLEAKHNSHHTIDCGHTSRGLFLGILSLMAAIACLILFFFLTSENYYDTKATLLIHIYQIALYLTMTVLTVVALLKLRMLDHNDCKSSRLEDILLAVCATSILSHDIVGIVSGIIYINKLKGLLVLATSLTELVQSLAQMSVIVMSLKLCTPDYHLPSTNSSVSKPGRECVTFLAVANIALWIISLFNVILSQGFNAQLLVIGSFSWEFIEVVLSPFVIFYYLFSASCFIGIWYNAYRTTNLSIVQV